MIEEINNVSTTRRTIATVVGYGTDPEPYLILSVPSPSGSGKEYAHIPVATFDSLREWPMRSKVRYTTIIEKIEEPQ